MLTIDLDTARRFILGKQGLWPGRRWRGRKDSALALYYLWRTGEVMNHHRERFERVYALTEAVAPAQLLVESDEAEADRFLIKKDISFTGLSRMAREQDSFHRGVPFE